MSTPLDDAVLSLTARDRAQFASWVYVLLADHGNMDHAFKVSSKELTIYLSPESMSRLMLLMSQPEKLDGGAQPM